MSKNIISGLPLGKNIINVVNSVDSDDDVVIKKVIATDSMKSFMKNSTREVLKKVTQTERFYKGIFNVNKNITNILNNAGIKTDKQIPKNKSKLLLIKGIGEKTAVKILKQLKYKGTK